MRFLLLRMSKKQTQSLALTTSISGIDIKKFRRGGNETEKFRWYLWYGQIESFKNNNEMSGCNQIYKSCQINHR